VNTVDDAVKKEAGSLLLTLVRATAMAGVKAWAISVAFRYLLEKVPSINPVEAWKAIEEIYESRIREAFPDQRDPAQSFKRASGDAWENFVESYINDNDALKKEGVKASRLTGKDFHKLMARLQLSLRPKDIDMFLQAIGPTGAPKIFAALFPKVSYAERIRADEPASRALMSKGLWSATVTLDARGELGSEDAPSVKRQTINAGGFDACYSFNHQTLAGGRIHVVDYGQKGRRNNPLVGGTIRAWRDRAEDPL
jgi:hypothetical protein